MTPLPRSAANSRDMIGFGIIIVGFLMNTICAGAPSPFYPVLQVQIGFSPLGLTAIFAVYALSLLATLLVLGSLSDHLGRRPILSIGFVLLSASALWFETADTVSGLVGARMVQGIAAGLLLSTLSATLVDLEPPTMSGAAQVSNSVLPFAGLGLGTLIAGIALDNFDEPRLDIFGGLIGLGSLVLALAVWTVRETAPLHGVTFEALRPRFGLPSSAKGAFWRAAPALVASWATGGLYLSLGSPIVAQIFGLATSSAQGAVLAYFTGIGALACFVARRYSARPVMLFGTAALGLGTALTLVSIAVINLPMYLLSLISVGAGFGTCFLAVIRSVVPLAAPGERSQLFSTLYTVSYLAFSVPAIAAGLMVTKFGLANATLAYGAAIVLLSAAAWTLRRFSIVP